MLFSAQSEFTKVIGGGTQQKKSRSHVEDEKGRPRGRPFDPLAGFYCTMIVAMLLSSKPQSFVTRTR